MRALLATAFVLFTFHAANAQETLTLRSSAKPMKVTIKSDTGLGIVALTPKEVTIPVEDIVDVEYDISPFAIRTTYKDAVKKEKDAAEGAKDTNRKLLLSDAYNAYDETHKKMAADPKAKRHIEYRLAMIKAKLVLENNFGSPDTPIQKLEDFRAAHPNCWQINSAMQTLARLYTVQKDYKKAQGVYADWAKMNVPVDSKQEAEFNAAMAYVEMGSHKEAAVALKALEAKLPKESRYSQKARVAQAECLALSKQLPEANKVLRQIIKDASDKNLKAMAYNTLGKNLFDVGQLKEARWEFLWVDVVYSQDKAEHAKALFYLWQIFDKLGEPERALECRESLMDRQFATSDYQLKAKSAAP